MGRYPRQKICGPSEKPDRILVNSEFLVAETRVHMLAKDYDRDYDQDYDSNGRADGPTMTLLYSAFAARLNRTIPNNVKNATAIAYATIPNPIASGTWSFSQ